MEQKWWCGITYKEIAEKLCDRFLDMPSGCEGCPLFDEDFLDEEGNMICELNRAKDGDSNDK